MVDWRRSMEQVNSLIDIGLDLNPYGGERRAVGLVACREAASRLLHAWT